MLVDCTFIGLTHRHNIYYINGNASLRDTWVTYITTADKISYLTEKSNKETTVAWEDRRDCIAYLFSVLKVTNQSNVL